MITVPIELYKSVVYCITSLEKYFLWTKNMYNVRCPPNNLDKEAQVEVKCIIMDPFTGRRKIYDIYGKFMEFTENLWAYGKSMKFSINLWNLQKIYGAYGKLMELTENLRSSRKSYGAYRNSMKFSGNVWSLQKYYERSRKTYEVLWNVFEV